MRKLSLFLHNLLHQIHALCNETLLTRNDHREQLTRRPSILFDNDDPFATTIAFVIAIRVDIITYRVIFTFFILSTFHNPSRLSFDGINKFPIDRSIYAIIIQSAIGCFLRP